LTSDLLLLGWERPSFATGVTRYIDSAGEAPRPEARIVIPIVPSPHGKTVLTIVDTAASWCVFKPDVGAALLDHFDLSSEVVSLSTRFGVFHGRLYRGLITLLADEGKSLGVDATVFLTPDWPGPNFLGYQGLLQRIRFAVDPVSNRFYFGPI
jgi:hypothetical protein